MDRPNDSDVFRVDGHAGEQITRDPADRRAASLYDKYRARGGKIQYLAQIGPSKDDLKTDVKQAKDAGAIGAFLLGNLERGDRYRLGFVGNIEYPHKGGRTRIGSDSLIEDDEPVASEDLMTHR